MTTKTQTNTGKKNTGKTTPKTTPKTEKTIHITTNGITSGKSELSIFNLTFNKKRITTPFFPHIIGKPEYDYDHHLDGERLEQLKEKHPEYTFFSFDKRGETEDFKNITIQSYGELMKYNLYKLIESGKLSHTTEHGDGEKTTYTMTWNGDPIQEPTIKTKEPKTPKEKQPKLEELNGLNFFD